MSSYLSSLHPSSPSQHPSFLPRLLKTNSPILFGPPESFAAATPTAVSLRFKHTQSHNRRRQTGTVNLMWEFQDNMRPLNTTDARV